MTPTAVGQLMTALSGVAAIVVGAIDPSGALTPVVQGVLTSAGSMIVLILTYLNHPTTVTKAQAALAAASASKPVSSVPPPV